jgi:hypothetical protein
MAPAPEMSTTGKQNTFVLVVNFLDDVIIPDDERRDSGVARHDP